MQSPISIREATPADFDAILSLIQELALFENAPDAVTNTVERMRSEQAYFRCFVAEDPEAGVVGMALYFIAYYTWVGKSLYLDDLYVRKEFRRRRIALQLLQRVFDVARREGCQRIRWQVLNWNEPALAMYRKCGALIDNEWSNCDFGRDAIERFDIHALPEN